jgi:hypothetical protein
MTSLSDLFSALPTILTAISAIAAASIAYLNYRSRPILMRTIERHSDDLKTLVSRWRDELPSFRWLEEGQFPVVQFPIRIESEFLFTDIWNHVPADLSLHETWTDFRLVAELHYVARSSFLADIDAHVRRITGLSQDSSFQKRGYTASLPMLLFQDTFQMLKHGDSRLNLNLPLQRGGTGVEGQVLVGPQGLATGNQGDLEKVEEIWKTFVKGMESDNPAMFKLALSLVEQERKFWHSREMLVRLMNEFTAVPIYSKRCKYVKRAEEAGRNIRLRRPSLPHFKRGPLKSSR